MAFKTRLTDLLGIAHPILCGGLMWLADARYVAACVNAGAMGFITMRSFPDPAAFRAELRACRALTGGRPFGVNLYLSVRAEQNEIMRTHVPILIEEGVRIVETSGGPPQAFLPQLRQSGAVIIHKVPSVRHAVSASKLGVDALAVVGAECGGHPGVAPVGTIVQAVEAARRVRLPLAIGGGIGHGSQIVAALAMGADGVVLGTRMLVAEEIWAHQVYKQRVVAARETDSRLVMGTFRNTHRVLDNAAARQVAELEATGVRDFEAYRPLVAGSNAREAYVTGNVEQGMLSLGQAAVFADAVKPTAHIIAQLMEEARAAQARVEALCRDATEVRETSHVG